MSDGPTSDVGLSDLSHVDRRLDPCGVAHLFEGVLESQGINDGSQHAHVIGLSSVHPGALSGHATPDVSPADHHSDVNIELITDCDNFTGNLGDDRPVDPVPVRSGKGLARDLKYHPVPSGRGPRGLALGTGSGHGQLPM